METSERDSTHVEFCTPLQPSHDKPSPLRIVKRSHKTAGKTPRHAACTADSTADFYKFPLNVAKRPSRRSSNGSPCSDAESGWLPRPKFWASSVELSPTRNRGWEDKLNRCRRFLVKSTASKDPWPQVPDFMRTPRRRLSSRRTASTASQPAKQPDEPSLLGSGTSSRNPSVSRSSVSRSSCMSGSSSGSDISPPRPLAIKVAGSAQQPFVLSPCITVTSEPMCHEHGRQTVWAAIEVTGRLSSISSSRSSSESSACPPSVTGSFIEHQLDRFFEFGCLYDLSVQVLPTAGTTVVAIMQEQAFPTTIYAGSSVFLLAHLQIDAEKARHRSATRHVRQKSDELIEDLELELGSSVAGYMRVNVSYSHSAFPEYSALGAHTAGGVFALRSRLETAATATLKCRAALSLWSPRSASPHAHVLSLVERHWGVDRALAIKHQMRACTDDFAVQDSPTPRKLQKTQRQTCDANNWLPARSTPTPKRCLYNKDSTPKAATFGKALGARAQRLLSASPPSTPPSMALRGSRGLDLPGPSVPAEDPPRHDARPASGTQLSGHGLRREGKSLGAQVTGPTPSPSKSGGVGMWSWGLWF